MRHDFLNRTSYESFFHLSTIKIIMNYCCCCCYFVYPFFIEICTCCYNIMLIKKKMDKENITMINIILREETRRNT